MKGRSQHILMHRDIDLTLKTPKGPQQANELGLLSCYISVAECRSILQRSAAFQYTKIQMS